MNYSRNIPSLSEIKRHEHWDNTVKYTNTFLIYKIFHGKEPPPLQEFVGEKKPQKNDNNELALEFIF